jgi:hypothetical protein
VGNVRKFLQIKDFTDASDSYTQRYPQKLWGTWTNASWMPEISAYQFNPLESATCAVKFRLPHNFIHRNCAEASPPAAACQMAAMRQPWRAACLFFVREHFFLINQRYQ